jgi:hypothetical protein
MIIAPSPPRVSALSGEWRGPALTEIKIARGPPVRDPPGAITFNRRHVALRHTRRASISIL